MHNLIADYPDYDSIIQQPMWLRRVKCNLKTNRYTSEAAFFSDLKQIWQNCKTYNSSLSVIAKVAEDLERMTLEKQKEYYAYQNVVDDNKSTTKCEVIKPKTEKRRKKANNAKGARKKRKVILQSPTRMIKDAKETNEESLILLLRRYMILRMKILMLKSSKHDY
jgi:hypothetical protein